MVAQVLRLSNPDLTRAGQRVLVALAHHANHHTGLCCPGYALLAQELLITERHLIRLIQRLEKDGFLEVRRGQGRGHLTVFRLKINPNDLRPIRRRTGDRSPPGKGDISTRRGLEKVTFSRTPIKVVEQKREKTEQVPVAISPRKCARDGCSHPQCPHAQQCAYHACCTECPGEDVGEVAEAYEVSEGGAQGPETS